MHGNHLNSQKKRTEHEENKKVVISGSDTGNETLDETALALANVNKDSVVDTYDLQKLCDYLAGNESLD